MKTRIDKSFVIDRRVQKTKKALSEALITLILAKGYEKVTIQDIIDKANIGRSTFYAHYESKEQLLLDGHNNLGVSLFGKDSTLDFLSLFSHAGENIQLAKAMLGKNSGGILISYLKNNIASDIGKQFKNSFAKTRSNKMLLKYFSDAAAAVVISLLVSWIEDDKSCSDVEIAEMCKSVVFSMFEKR